MSWLRARPSSAAEEVDECGGQSVGVFLCDVVAGVDGGTLEVIGPGLPDGQRVSVKVFHVVMGRPQEQRGALHGVSGAAIGFLVLAVNGETCAVVLEHRLHGVRVAGGAAELLVALGAHALGGAAVPGVWVGEDGAFGSIWLGEEEPVESVVGELGVAAGESLADRYPVHDHEVGEGCGMVQCHPEGDVAASVMTDDSESFVAQAAHQRVEVLRDCPLGLLAVVAKHRWLAGLAVTAHVRADHAEAGSRQLSCDPVPRGTGAGCPWMSRTAGPAPPCLTRSDTSPTLTISSANSSNMRVLYPRSAVLSRRIGPGDASLSAECPDVLRGIM